MPTRNVVLTDRQTVFVEQMVSNGRYQNASEVLREGLRLIERREQEDASRLELLRQAVKIGVADISQGRFRSFATSQAIGSNLRSLATEVIAST